MNLVIYFSILTIIAGLMALMEKVAFHYEKSIFPQSGPWRDFCDVLMSYDNKYKNGDPKQGPKFPFSTTLLVMFTDLWHLSKFLWLILFIFIGFWNIEIINLIFGLSELLAKIVDTLIVYTYIGLIHNLFFHIILHKTR
jgi:hypothetical protein